MQGDSLYHFMMVFGITRPGLEPTIDHMIWEADTLTTKPPRRGMRLQETKTRNLKDIAFSNKSYYFACDLFLFTFTLVLRIGII